MTRWKIKNIVIKDIQNARSDKKTTKRTKKKKKKKAETKALQFWKEEPSNPELVVMRPTLILGPEDERFSSVTIVNEFINRNIPIVPSGGLSFVSLIYFFLFSYFCFLVFFFIFLFLIFDF